MALDAATRQAVVSGAKSRGVDPDEAIAEAERIAAEGDADTERGVSSGPERPTFERLLIGVLPFIKVRELRSIWLGLDERIPDDEMMCGDFRLKHGGAGPVDPATE